MDSSIAKQFLISKVVEEAEVEHVSLSEVEKKMLHFTEVHPSLPDIYAVNEEFEQNYDATEYEEKVSSLLKNARDRDREKSSGGEQQWKEALDALKSEDHYILVMVNQAFGSGSVATTDKRLRDFLMYAGIGIGLVALIILKSLWKAGH